MMAQVTLDGNGDAVEFCPNPAFYHLLAAATYTLQEGPRPTRAGTLSLFSVYEKEEKGEEEEEKENGDGGRLCPKLTKVHQLATNGIFDIKWKPPQAPDAPLLAQASADGSLVLYELREKSILTEVSKEDITNAMCLLLDWDPYFGKQICISHSDGHISVLDVGGSAPETLQTGVAHNYEAWSVTYDMWRSNVIYSGGDDCHFCCWDLRQGLFRPVFREKVTHQMGVCTIQCSLHDQNVLATGSYDENLRIWDVRILDKPLSEKALGLGGGVWKLKWNPHHKDLIAAACMHNGLSLVNIQNDPSCMFEYKEHGSLAYGVDWFKGPTEKSSHEHNSARNNLVSKDLFMKEDSGEDSCFLLASCSFYDRSLHVWKPVLSSGRNMF